MFRAIRNLIGGASRRRADYIHAGDDGVLIQESASEASEIALRHFGQDPETWKKQNDSPVSRADIEVDEYLRGRLLDARPDYGWLSEETEDDRARLGARSVFIVDPIDGTRAFLDGKDEFAIVIAVAENGRVVEGAVLAPQRMEGFCGGAGMALMNGETLDMDEGPPLDEARVLGRRKVFRADQWEGPPPQAKRGYLGSLALQVCEVAAGRWDAAICLGSVNEWDVAGTAPVIEEAGGVLTDRHGAPLRFNQPDPRFDGMIAAPPRLHAEIVERLAPSR